MSIVLAFAPFVAFALVDRVRGATSGPIAGSAAAVALLARAALSPAKAVKSARAWDGSSVLRLDALHGCRPTWSLVGIRLRVDIGLLIVVLMSIAIQRPFTIQYAREQVAREYWGRPEFVRANYIITAVWSLAFAVTVIGDLLLLKVSRLPPSIGIAATVLALVGAAQFTRWYPTRARVSVAHR